MPTEHLDSADDLAQILGAVLSILPTPRAQSPLDTLQVSLSLAPHKLFAFLDLIASVHPQALANTKIGVAAPTDHNISSLQVCQTYLWPMHSYGVSQARECVRFIIREGIAKRSGEGGQQQLLRLLLGSLPATPASNVALTLTLLQEIRYWALLNTLSKAERLLRGMFYAAM